MSQSPFHGIFSSFQSSSSPFESESGGAMASSLHIEEEPAHVPQQQTGQIAVDIYEQDNYYIIRAPIAGVKISELDIEVDGKVVTIRGERRMTDDIPSNQYYLQECFWGQFSRSVTLPIVVDPKKIKATFSKDSILKVLVPKEEKVKIVRVSES